MKNQVEQFKAEIEKVKLIIQSNRAQGAFAEGYLIGQESVLEHFDRFVKSIQEEPVSEDLDIAIGEYCSNPDNFITYIDVAFAYRSEQKDDIPLIIKAIKFGAQWQKQQMMKDATDVTVHIECGNYPYIPQIELYDYDKDIPLAKEGDKYKVVLIKKE